ncbi:MAG: YfaZ family protein [Gammaproteobacteria bacterium]|nr:YfaZ family protein [Gammaproteobacteria bacterium]
MLLRKLFIAAFLFSASSSLAMAQSLDINLGDKSASFRYNAFVGGSTFGRTELNFGVLYNEDKNRYADIGLLVVDTAGSKAPGLEVGIGPKVMFLWENDRDAKGTAIALGGRLNFKPQKMKRLRLGLEGYFAPSITSFQDIDNAYTLEGRVGYEILPTATAYVGYRSIRASLNKNQGTQTIDQGAFLGIQLFF